MSLRTGILVGSLIMAGAGERLVAQSTGATTPGSTHDSAFTALQARGKVGMGVDQYTSTHRFDDLPDGGRIELQVDPSDTSGVRSIREHLRGIAKAFTAGNFTTPGFVHDGEVPGTAVMASRREHITYRFGDLPGGGEVRVSTADADALKAIRMFLSYQRHEHHAPGTELPPPR